MPHIHEKIDFTVSIFIVQDQKVLFIFHKQLQRWLPIGGHIELEEHPEQAAIREAKEESGLDVELVGEKSPFHDEPGFVPLMTPSYMDMHLIKEPHWHIGLIYFARVKSGEVRLNTEEHQDIQWLGENDFENPRWELTAPLKFYAREAIKKVENS
ncbi:MAG TPA: NUDIX domain-containing protein [bacterium]|nr:NUDIX domain-containing protein [bacterium]